jgi:hypothetical protein
MKLLFRLLSIAIVFCTIITFTSVRHAAAATCVVASGTNPPTAMFPFTSLPQHRYLVAFRGGLGIDFDVPIAATSTSQTYSVFLGTNQTATVYDLDCVPLLPQPLFTDGRENKNDAIQTAAVYCGVPNSGDVRVYALFNNVGYLAFTVTKAELAAGVQKPATPYLIKSAKGAELWRLQDGSLRIKRGTYVFDWPGC